MKKLAYLFPGQGAQYVGMGKDLAHNSERLNRYLAEANETLGMNLTGVMFEGDEDQLKQTWNAQPAIFLHQTAILQSLEHAGHKPSIVAGHSVGEYAALVAAGVLDFGHGLWLMKQRGALMQRAAEAQPGGMAAVLGLDDQQVAAACSQAGGDCVVANYNSPGQVVISGEKQALEKAIEACTAAGAKKVVPLAVSGAFHSPAMQSSAEALNESIERTAFADAQCPVVTNVDGQAHVSGEQIRANLRLQMVSSVQWTRTMETIVKHEPDALVEIGPGTVLSGLAKRSAPGIPCYQIGTWEQLQAFLAAN